ncbi:flagellin [Acidimangrovimonas sediminis]|uniref:flagellin n=1 Tax=Acidimangrovimonas sediminis TaxID=2056283 RepID=UPI000C8057FF|nr:flagellin [Acidimangrovimonas sediminis]
MALVSLGDMAQSFMLRNQNTQLKSNLQRHMQEVTTGRAQDLGKRVAGNYAPLAGIERSLARLGAYATATDEAALMTDAMQTALTSVNDLVEGLTSGLWTSAQARQSAHVDALGADAASRFASALSQLNGQVGDRTMFAGTATDGPALAGSETILAALDTAISGATTADDVARAVSDWFDDPAGFATVGYLGNTQDLAPVTIGDGTRLSSGIRADNTAIRDTLKGLAMAAMLDRGALSGDADGRANLATRAGEKLTAATSDLTDLQARLGVSQARIEEAATRNTAEASSLQVARAGIVSVDPYDAASALQETQTQLETLYAITARLQGLSLMDYL